MSAILKRTNMPLGEFEARGRRRIPANRSVDEFVDDMASANGIESVRIVLRRGFQDGFHRFGNKPIDHHMNGFVFRVNERQCEEPYNGTQ